MVRPKFSGRFEWAQNSNRLSRLVAGKRASGAPVLDLTVSNPTRVELDYPDWILPALADPAGLTYDPAPAGLLRAREAVSRYYASRGERVEPEQVILTASTSEAYSFLFKLLADPGDRVLAPKPSYPLFDYLGRLDGIELGSYQLHYDGRWWLDVESLEAAITPRSKAILAVSPNNPTGSCPRPEEWATVTQMCEQRALALIVDEVFSDFRFGGNDAVNSDNMLVFRLNGLSKILGLPQMKLAWIVVEGDPEQRAAAIEALEIIADTYLSVATPVQLAAAGWLDRRERVQGPIRERLRENLATLEKVTQSSAVELLTPEGGWSAVIRLPRTRTEEEWVLDLLASDNTLVQPGYFFDFEAEAYIVVSLLTPPEEMSKGIGRVVAAASGG